MTVDCLRIKLSIRLLRKLIIFSKSTYIVFKGDIHADAFLWFLRFLNLAHGTYMRSPSWKQTLIFNTGLVVETIFRLARFRLRCVFNSRKNILHAFGMNSKPLICSERHHLSVLTHIKYRF